MPYYIDTENKLHWLDYGQSDALLPQGSVEITDEEARAITNPAPTTAQIIAALEDGVQNYLDAKAKAKGYDSASRCIGYLNSTNATWKSEATLMNAWRDAAWAYCANLEQTETSPPTLDQLIAKLPAAPW